LAGKERVFPENFAQTGDLRRNFNIFKQEK